MDSSLDRFRDPAYTGTNRCWPCTAVNVLLLAAGTLLTGLLTLWPLAGAVAVAGAVVIWLRGYLVPYTPQFAPRLVGKLPVDPFHVTDGGTPVDQQDHSSLANEESAVDGEQLMQALLESGVLVVDDETDQLSVAPSVRSDWDDAIDRYAALEPEELGARIRVLANVPSVQTNDEGNAVWYSLQNGSAAESKALSRPVAVAEIAALDALESYVDDETIRRQAIEPLRMFLETCPVCRVDLVETDTLDCCGGLVNPKQKPQEVLACPQCDRRLYTFPA